MLVVVGTFVGNKDGYPDGLLLGLMVSVSKIHNPSQFISNVSQVFVILQLNIQISPISQNTIVFISSFVTPVYNVNIIVLLTNPSPPLIIVVFDNTFVPFTAIFVTFVIFALL